VLISAIFGLVAFRSNWQRIPTVPSNISLKDVFNCLHTNEKVARIFKFPVLKRLNIQCVPLATENGISLIILTPMKILQRNVNSSAFVVSETKRDVSAVRFEFRCDIFISAKIIKEMPGSVARGTPCIIIAPTCFGTLAPSSGSQYFVLAEVTKYENIKITYSSTSVG
jgi:hypothetical protein